MKKSILVIFSFIFCVFSSFGERIYKEMEDGTSKWLEKISERHFDENGNTTYSIDEFGQENWFTYDKYGNMIYIKNSSGFEGWYDVDKHGNVTHFKNNQGFEIWSEFDENNNEIRCYDKDGFERWQEFDEDNNILTVSDSSGYQCWYSYDDNGNLVHEIDDSGNETFLDYDKNNNLIHERKIYTETELEVENFYEYDKKGNLIYEDVNMEECWYEYDKNNNIIEEKDSTDFVGKYKYDYKLKFTDDTEYDAAWYNTMWYEAESFPDYLVYYENTNDFNFTLTYDKYGHITKYEDNIGIVYIYEYEYYKNGSVKSVIEYNY